MSVYIFKDIDDEELSVRSYQASYGTVASVYTNGDTVWVTADEAPKAAQAILDAAGVKGAVLTGELPKVTVNEYGTYHTTGYSYHPDGVADINTHIRGLLAIKLRMEADAKAEADSFNAKLKQAAERIEAENKAAAVKKAHDDLRTSPIALKALAIYNRACIGCGPYESWDATLDGDGVGDDTIRHFIGLAEEEEAKEKEDAEKLAARRDELVRNHALGLDAYCYDDLDVNGKYLVDRLRIALDEGKDAKGVKAA